MCFSVNYTIPLYIFRGTSGIDIDLQKVDIDQCPNEPGEELNVFADSARCKKETTKVISSKTKLCKGAMCDFRLKSESADVSNGIWLDNSQKVGLWWENCHIMTSYRRQNSDF